jgi:hypothetical protein
MSQSFEFPDKTVKVMNELQKTFGVTSNSQVISMALGLAKMLSEKADDQNSILVIGKDKDTATKITLSE